MTRFPLTPFLGALVLPLLASTAQAQTSTMTFTVFDPAWVFQGSTFQPQTNDPQGILQVNGSSIDTFTTSSGDHAEGSGTATDTTANGQSLVMEAVATGTRTASWLKFVSQDMPFAEVRLSAQLSATGGVRLTRQHAAAAALGWARISTNILGGVFNAVLTSSQRETLSGLLGNPSAATAGLPGAPMLPLPSLGTGVASQTVTSGTGAGQAIAFITHYGVTHQSRAYIQVVVNLLTVGTTSTCAASMSADVSSNSELR